MDGVQIPEVDMHIEEFTCDECGGVFTKGWSDEEAEAEARDFFGEGPSLLEGYTAASDPDMAVVCDVCWQKMGFGK